MPSTTHTDFNEGTEGIAVAAAFPNCIKGRTILITGVNKKGIGYTTAEAFASQSPSHLILAGRSRQKVQDCIDALSQVYPKVDYRFLELDLSSQETVRAAASQVLSWSEIPTIDLLINNAAVMNLPKRTLTPEGVEMHIATNHLGHFLLTNLLAPKLLAAAQKPDTPKRSVRVVNVSSSGTYVSPFRFTDPTWAKPAADIPDSEKPNFAVMKAAQLSVTEQDSYISIAAYGMSKTANVLFSTGLNQQFFEKYGIMSMALHPGEITTELTRHTDQEWLSKVANWHNFKSQEAGSATTLIAALDPKLAVFEEAAAKDTLFLTDCQVWKAPPYAINEEHAKTLWELSETWVGQNFAY